MGRCGAEGTAEAIYEIHLLENSLLQFVAIEESPSRIRAGFVRASGLAQNTRSFRSAIPEQSVST